MVSFCKPSFACLGLLLSGCVGPSSYEECMLDKMKGQTPAMQSIAHKTCSKKFDVEQNVSFLRDKLKNWDFDQKTVVINFDESDGDYIITKGRFAFSNEIGTENEIKFSDAQTIVFRSGQRVTASIPPGTLRLRILELWGKYK